MRSSPLNCFRWERSFNKDKLKYYYCGNRKQKVAEMRSDRILEGPGYARLRGMRELDRPLFRSPAYNPATGKFNPSAYRRFRWNPEVASVDFFWLGQSKPKGPVAEFPDAQLDSPRKILHSLDGNNLRHRIGRMNCQEVMRTILGLPHGSSQGSELERQKMIEKRFLEVWASSYPKDLQSVYGMLTEASRLELEAQFERRRKLQALPRYLRGAESLFSALPRSECLEQIPENTKPTC
ncbi:vacuolar ATP synthase subunit b [Perkinsela sp. CCAP 1560/4]|nr:vacuolar ATP synthase subunit b [Perkinsela sp. CCAP 1560/4]|eukprot:KNH01742.1 vacuolar ATP synthase subunit b [Perkinsela sp. CCAP 1560/4]